VVEGDDDEARAVVLPAVDEFLPPALARLLQRRPPAQHVGIVGRLADPQALDHLHPHSRRVGDGRVPRDAAAGGEEYAKTNGTDMAHGVT